MAIKIEMNGKGVAMLSNAQLETYANGEKGKKRHKAQMELNKRNKNG